MTLISDLFDTLAVPGAAYRGNFISLEEEAALIARIDAEKLMPFRFQQWTGKRLTHSFGYRYDFENGDFAETAAIPDWLEDVKARAAAFAQVARSDLVQALLTRYDPGAGIGWHRDRPVFEHVVGVSLGHAATLRLRRRTACGFDRTKLELAPRSIYHLSGEVRHLWEHSLAAMDQPRWSITFRSLSDPGHQA